MKLIQGACVFFIMFLSGCQRISPYRIEKPTSFLVHVTGAVHNPGDFEIVPYGTMEELLEQVQLHDDADLSVFNLKTILHHHDHITIPVQTFEACININHATHAQLMTLPNIGEVMANRIINYRDTHGFFQKLEDIMLVKGIKNKTFEKIKERLCL